jgi:hypothetical protein
MIYLYQPVLGFVPTIHTVLLFSISVSEKERKKEKEEFYVDYKRSWFFLGGKWRVDNKT